LIELQELNLVGETVEYSDDGFMIQLAHTIRTDLFKNILQYLSVDLRETFMFIEIVSPY